MLAMRRGVTRKNMWGVARAGRHSPGRRDEHAERTGAARRWGAVPRSRGADRRWPAPGAPASSPWPRPAASPSRSSAGSARARSARPPRSRPTPPRRASPITIPVVRRTLSAKVIVRGTVRYGAPQAVVLATSRIKQGASSDIVTRAPRPRAELGAGSVAMTVDGRPVFVLPGGIPMHRDLARRPWAGRVPARACAATARVLHRCGGRPLRQRPRVAAVELYPPPGLDPFGPTDAQLDQLHVAEAAAAQARDARLQALKQRRASAAHGAAPPTSRRPASTPRRPPGG